MVKKSQMQNVENNKNKLHKMQQNLLSVWLIYQTRKISFHIVVLDIRMICGRQSLNKNIMTDLALKTAAPSGSRRGSLWLAYRKQIKKKFKEVVSKWEEEIFILQSYLDPLEVCYMVLYCSFQGRRNI